MRGLTRGVVVLAAGAAAVLATSGRAAAVPPVICQPDIQKFCPNVPEGGGRILGCLQEHASQLTPGCQDALKGVTKHFENRRTVRDANRAWVSACTGDIQKLCHGVPAGAGRIAQCLGQHQSELSDNCKAAFGPAAK